MTTAATTASTLDDRQEITDLVSRLGVALDEGRFDDLGALLVADATARTPGGEAQGRDALVAQAGRNHRADQPIQHLITNLLVDIDGGGDRAQARANLVVHFGPPDGPLGSPVTFTMGEVYRFGLRRTADGWRFSRIETTPVWTVGDRPVR